VESDPITHAITHRTLVRYGAVVSPDQRGDDDPPVPGWDAVVAHNRRFRQVADRYPRRVVEAYGGDFERAAADSDDTVAATVAAWERARGGPALDWPAIGAAERGET
jgi:nucleoside-diphosphate-sugar epimerase